MRLWDFAKEYRDFLENPPVDADGCIDTEKFEAFEKLEGSMDEKIEAVALYIKERKMLFNALDEEEKTLSERKKAVKNDIDRLTNYLGNSLKLAKKDEFQTSKCKLSFRKSESVEVDEDLLPKKYCNKEIKYKPDKKLLKDLLKAKKVIKGATLIEKQNLQIK